ncbi:MAG: peptide ABC transporter substrate-binding protein [Alphaproteobacteria bacterium]|nr:peptide ABC transporter substrate-binding protein [Alphaproteobacteria bacterium]
MATLTRRAALAGSAAAVLAACGSRSNAPDALLRVAIDSEPDSLNPLRGQFASSALLYKQLHAPLTEYSPSGGLAPGLASSWRSADARTWRFILREGLVWSDGTPLTAEDVVWTAQRAVDPASGFADLGDFFAVRNARAALRGEVSPEAIGVSAPDLRTVIFELDQPVALFPVLMREFYPLPRHALEASPEAWIRPEGWVSAGAYLLSERSALSFTLDRNPRFHAAGSVAIEQVQVQVIEDAAARARRFRAGDLDLADRPPSDQIGFLRGELGDLLRAYPAPILTYIKVNCAKPHLSDPRVRQALSLAIGRRRLNNQFFNGEAAPTALVIPDEDHAAPARAPDSARALLAEAGFGPDTPLSVNLRATAGDRDRVAVAIMDDFAEAGIQTTLTATYPNDLYQAVDGGDYDLALARFDRGLKSDPEFMIQPFARDGFADNTNWTGPQRAAFDALIDAASEALEAADRLNLLREAERIFIAEMSSIPLLHERAYWMVSDRVEAPDRIQPQLWRDLVLG